MKFKKKLFSSVLFLIALIVSVTQVKAQTSPPPYMPTLTDYDVTFSSHAAYATASSFNADHDYIRGFCFAFDAVSPLANGSTAATVYHVIPSKNQYGEDFSGVPWDVSMGPATIIIPVTNDWYANAVSVEGYGDSIYQSGLNAVANGTATDITPYKAAQNFWHGYAQLIRMAAVNPNILLLTLGNSI